MDAHAEAYGTGPDQFGEWFVPSGDAPFPLVVLIHGGFWRPMFALDLERAVAARLAAEGFIVWNIEYSRAGSPWPQTLLDVAAAYDHAVQDPRIDPGHVNVVGHSAGGHLALWLASRSDRTPGGPPQVRPRLAVGQAPVACLALAHEQRLGDDAVDRFVGGSPAACPTRYADADPMALLPSSCDVTIIHGDEDDRVPLSISQAYAKASGCRLLTYAGGHFEHLDPDSEAVTLLIAALCSQASKEA